MPWSQIGGGRSLAVINSVSSSSSWTTKADMPTARELLAAASPGNGKIYAIGGYTGSYLTKNEEYDPATNTWTTKADMPTARSGLAAAPPGNGKIYAIGGYTGSSITAKNEEYDPVTNTWTTKVNILTARSGLAAASPGNGKIYAIGGTTGSSTAKNEEFSAENIITLFSVKTGDIVYFYSVDAVIKLNNITILLNQKYEIPFDGDLVLESGSINYGWIEMV